MLLPRQPAGGADDRPGLRYPRPGLSRADGGALERGYVERRGDLVREGVSAHGESRDAVLDLRVDRARDLEPSSAFVDAAIPCSPTTPNGASICLRAAPRRLASSMCVRRPAGTACLASLPGRRPSRRPGETLPVRRRRTVPGRGSSRAATGATAWRVLPRARLPARR